MAGSAPGFAAGRRWKLASLRLAALGLALVIADSAGALGAQPETQTPATSSVSYAQDFFAKYDVTTAEDILRRIPGAAAILDAVATQANERGFGSRGDQILINGKRMAGKGQIAPTLRRLQVANIARIDLVRGTSEDIDVQSEGVVINVILKEGSGIGAGSWQLDNRITDHRRINADGLINYSDSRGRLDYIIGFERNLLPPKGNAGGDWHNRDRDERYFFPNGALSDLRDQKIVRRHDKGIFTANLAYNFDNGDRAGLNGLFEPRNVIEDDETAVTRFDAAGRHISSSSEFHRRHSGWVMRWELGGDYVRAVGADGTLNTLFIYSSSDNPVDEYRNQLVAGNTLELSRNLTNQLTTEGILRSSYSWPVAKGQSLEVGAELARNRLSQNIRVFFDLSRDGRVEEIAIPTAHAEVQELRGEVFSNYNWAIADGLSLESSLNTEFSKITNNYPLSIPAKSVFVKPHADLRYEVSEADQIRLKAERTVSQLAFGNFVPVFDVVDSEIDAGNPDLKPEKAWAFEVGYQHRLPQRQGLLEGRVFYRAVADHIDKFIIRTEPSGERVSAIGNIGAAWVSGGEVKAGVRLGWLGLPDVGIDARFLRQWSRSTDPFTRRERSIKDFFDYELELGFRHDYRPWRLSYGVKYADSGGETIQSDIRVLRLFERGPRLEAFAEKALPWGLTVRIEGYGLMPEHNREYQSRILYVRDALDGRISRTERFVERKDRRLVISLRGRF